MGLTWLLEEHDDSAELCSEALVEGGHGVVRFSSATELLRATAEPRAPWPSVALIDAWTARGFEPDIARALVVPMVILTTSFVAVARWTALGASHFLPKPFDVAQLVAHALVLQSRSAGDLQMTPQ